MKRIVLLVIIALVILPRANAEHMTTEYNDHRSEFVHIAYKLESNTTKDFTIDTFHFGFLMFHYEPNETIIVTSIILKSITIDHLILESPTWCESARTTEYRLAEENGSFVLKGTAQTNSTYMRIMYDDWNGTDYIIRATNNDDIALVTVLSFEFKFSFTYTITRQVIEDSSILDPIEVMILVGIACGIVGASFGFVYRPIFDHSMANIKKKHNEGDST